MRDLNFERKHAEDLQRLRGLRLLDDDFMNKVFEDTSCAEFLLQILLQRTDLRVQCVHGQHDIKICRGDLYGWIFWQWMKRTVSITLRCSAVIRVQASSAPDTTAA